MTIEILCDGCADCGVVEGKVCQAVIDLNLNAKILSDHDPRKHRSSVNCDGPVRIRIDGLVVSTRSDCSVRDLKQLLNQKERHEYS